MIELSLIITWIIFCIVDGITDGFTFNKSYLANNFNNNWKGIDIHAWFTLKRSITYLYVVFLAYYYAGVESAILIALSNCLVFPFLHDGTMYLSRKKNYPLGFFHDPTLNDTSSAKLNIGTPTRILLFALGMGLYSILLIII